VFAGIAHIPPLQAAWTFDTPSFLIGVIAALVIVGLIYLFRQPLRDGAQTMRGRLLDMRERLTAGAERHYVEALIERLNDLHLGESSAPFDDLYLPARFDSPHTRPSLTSDAAEPRSISIPQAMAAAQRLAILGESGSGRTALLVYVARSFVLRTAHDALRLDEHRLPILIHLSEIDWTVNAEPEDSSGLLIDAAILHSPRLIAANLTPVLKSKLGSKGLLLLIDGWDEIAPEERDAAKAWLAKLLERNPGQRVLLSASSTTWAPLEELGFAGLAIRPLQPREIQALAGRWAKAAGGGASDATMLAESMRQPPGTTPRPLDFTIVASVWHKRGSLPLNTLSAYERWIDVAIGEIGLTDTLTTRSILAQLAWTMLEEERSIATREEIASIATGTLPQVVEAGKPAKTGADIGAALADSALFVPMGRGLAFAHRRLAAYLAACHARDTGQAMALAARLRDPAYEDVTYFFAGLGDASPLVTAALAVPDDLFRTTLTRLGRWASIAPANAAWRGRVMGELVKQLMQADAPEPLREQLMRAVVSTRDKGLAYLYKQMIGRSEPEFKRLGLRSFGLMRREADAPIAAGLMTDGDPGVQAETLRALGEIGGQAAVDTLAQALLEMDDQARRIAAESLANCGKAGWELLKEGATLPDDQGSDVIRVRRAAVFGLARIDQAWALDLLHKIERDDNQWAVRSSATEALKLIAAESGDGEAVDLSRLNLDNLGWLVQWSASKGQPIGLGKSAAQALQRALADLDPKVRLAAVHTYANLGDVESVPLLRTRLKDESPHIREAAYHALEAIAQRHNTSVPQ
jgi:HEAT repeat protein